MMRSMFSGVSGLRVHQTKMDVIANNISNVNTVGFKSSRVTFNEVFSQTLSGASGANPTSGRGGTNPMQIGLGANVASIDMIMTPGAAQRTDNPYDLMIQGDAFFILSDNSGVYFTRAGAFRLDNEGNLTDPSGLLVNGWDTQLDGDTDSPTYGQYVVQTGKCEPVRIEADDESVDPVMTTKIEFSKNINPHTDNVKESTIAFYDSLGTRYVVDVQYTYNSQYKNWDIKYGNYMYPNGDKKAGINIAVTKDDTTVANDIQTLKIDTIAKANPPVDFAWSASMGTLKFNTSGYVDLAADGTKLGAFSITSITDSGNALNPESEFKANLLIDLKKLTQFDSPTDAAAVTVDGNTAGQLSGISIGTDGKITGRYTNGDTKVIAQIAVARFKNPAGLEKLGNNLFITTSNSGDFDGVGVDPTSGGGKLLGGVLEMSNVDLSLEFTEMITTQRGFQANSRVITTSDEMLQELVNLKR